MSTVNLKDHSILTIEEATPSHSEGMIKYLSTVGGESDNLLIDKDGIQISVEEESKMIESFLKSNTSVMLVGTIDGEIVSVASMSSSPKKRIAHSGEFALSVRKKCWNLGIGSAMMDALIDFAKSNGVTKVLRLGVKANNTHAIHLYERKGFKEVGRHEKFFLIDGNFYDLILMDMCL